MTSSRIYLDKNFWNFGGIFIHSRRRVPSNSAVLQVVLSHAACVCRLKSINCNRLYKNFNIWSRCNQTDRSTFDDKYFKSIQPYVVLRGVIHKMYNTGNNCKKYSDISSTVLKLQRLIPFLYVSYYFLKY